MTGTSEKCDRAHILAPKWRRKLPKRLRRRLLQWYKFSVFNHLTPRRVSLTGNPRALRRTPAIQRDAETDLVSGIPVAHSGCGQKISKTTIEPHRRNDDYAGLDCGVTESVECGLCARLLGRDVEVVDAGAHRRCRYCVGRVQKRPGAVDDCGSAGKRAVERSRIIDGGGSDRDLTLLKS